MGSVLKSCSILRWPGPHGWSSREGFTTSWFVGTSGRPSSGMTKIGRSISGDWRQIAQDFRTDPSESKFLRTPRFSVESGSAILGVSTVR